MRQIQRIIFLLGTLLLVGLLVVSPAAAQEATTEPEATPEATSEGPAPQPVVSQPTSPAIITHVVNYGETLFSIARRYGTTVQAIASENGIVNPSLIYAGQVLRIPTPGAQPQTPTPLPQNETITYRVQPGDTLLRIAARYNTTVANLVQLNNLRNPNFIYVGQNLIIQQGAAPVNEQAAVLTPTPETPPAEEVVQAPETTETAAPVAAVAEAGSTAASPGFASGVVAFLPGQNIDTTVAQISTLGVGWVKVIVNWRDLEPAQGQYQFNELDAIVDALAGAGISILFTVSTAPDWSRPGLLDEDGPPTDFSTYAAFVGELASRYSGQVQAYQIWNEPNLRREWNSIEAYDAAGNPSEVFYPIGAATYIELLRQAYNAIKNADPTALVISAGLAPTGFDDGINAINDRRFLNDLYALGLVLVSDGIGAHPGGWANPPDANCCTPAEGVLTHFEDRSFYFLDTLTDYRRIMEQNGDADTEIWVTKFGWGSSADTAPITDERNVYIYVNYTDLTEQANYVLEGFNIGASLGYVGPMFVDNLNACQAFGSGSPLCYFSLYGPDGSPRPVFDAVSSVADSTP